jgi:hypothetical protein
MAFFLSIVSCLHRKVFVLIKSTVSKIFYFYIIIKWQVILMINGVFLRLPLQIRTARVIFQTAKIKTYLRRFST